MNKRTHYSKTKWIRNEKDHFDQSNHEGLHKGGRIFMFSVHLRSGLKETCQGHTFMFWRTEVWSHGYISFWRELQPGKCYQDEIFSKSGFYSWLKGFSLNCGFYFLYLSRMWIFFKDKNLHLQILSVHIDGSFTDVFVYVAETPIKISSISMGDEE